MFPVVRFATTSWGSNMVHTAQPNRRLYDIRLWLASNVTETLAPHAIRPTDASIKLTENCQARCVTCDYWRHRWTDHITTDKAVQLVDQLGALGVTTVRFTGGEPLLRRDLFEVMKRADTSRFDTIGIQTNGLLLRRLADEVNASALTHVTVSLDGVAERNDEIRGIKGYFDKALAGLELLENKTIIIATTLTQVAALDLDELIDHVQRLGGFLACNLPDNRLYFLQEAELAGLWPDAGATATIVATLRRRLGHQFAPYELSYVEKYLRAGSPELRELNPPCVLGYTTLYIGSDGSVRSGCYVLPPLGNILNQDLADILASDAYAQRCRAMLRLDCPGCGCNVFKSLRHRNMVQDQLRSISPRSSAIAEG